MHTSPKERRISDAHDRLLDASTALTALLLCQDRRDVTSTLRGIDAALVSLNQARNLYWLARRNDELRILVSDTLRAPDRCDPNDEHRLMKADVI
jgi:hypothetical protein